MDAIVIGPKEFKLLPPRPGLCAVCAFDHAEHLAHNIQSLFYEARFRQQYGRAPTWADACAHLSDEDRLRWQLAMQGKTEWTEPTEGEPIAEPYAMAM